jgi:hypothetical protein
LPSEEQFGAWPKRMVRGTAQDSAAAQSGAPLTTAIASRSKPALVPS